MGGRLTGPARKKSHVLGSYRPCLYCYENLDNPLTDKEGKGQVSDTNKQPPRKNMKAHLALTHGVQVCEDAGIQVDNVEQGVKKEEFFSQLHVVTEVHASLGVHSYTLFPACHFFTVM